jgi:hypothetical protein
MACLNVDSAVQYSEALMEQKQEEEVHLCFLSLSFSAPLLSLSFSLSVPIHHQMSSLLCQIPTAMTFCLAPGPK